MATYYGLHCLTCDAYSDTWVRSEAEKLAELVRVYPTIKALWETYAAAEFPWFVEVEITYTGLDGERPHYFLDEHYGHHLAVYDEYGRDHPEVTLPQCPKEAS